MYGQIWPYVATTMGPKSFLTNIVELIEASVPPSIHFELLLELLLDAVAQIGWRDIGIGLTEAQIQIHDVLVVVSTGILSWLRFDIERV